MKVLLVICVCLGLSQNGLSLERTFNSIVDDFVEDTGLTGATVAVLEDDRLVYVAGKGNIRGHSAAASTLVPILELSKLITAVAVLQLHENGRLQMNDKVFGKHGLLYYIKPSSGRMDPRLQHVTVGHLLHHTAGWDEGQRPLYDPMINALFVRKGFQVANIAKEMELFGIPNQDDIMHFMVNQLVAHHPGSLKKHSNFGYCILGRIIEEISGLTYEDYVKRNILEPSGMWKTRIGPQPTQTYQSLKPKTAKEDWFNIVNDDDAKKGYIPLGDEHIKSLFDSVPPAVLDSTLGWHSTTHDMARFFTSLMKRGDEGLLKPDTLEILFIPTELSQPTDLDGDQFESMAFHIQGDGSCWQASRNYDVAITEFFYHKPSSSGYPEHFAESSDGKATDMTMFFFGVSDVSDKKLLALADELLQPSLVPSDTTKEFMAELLDSHFVSSSHDVGAKYRLPEDSLMAYVEALRIAGCHPLWIHANTFKQETHFDVVFKVATTTDELDFDVSVYSSREKTKNYVKKALTNGYQVSLMQTYKSTAHNGHLAHLTLMTPVQKAMTCIYDLDTDLKEYLTVKAETEQEGFIPMIQSIEVVNNGLRASFLLNQLTDDNHQLLKTPSRIYHDLQASLLEHVALENAKSNYFLVHLDTHIVGEENHFSAIFHQRESHNWFLQINIKEDSMKKEATKWNVLGYAPRILVSYVTENALQYVCLWVSQ